jgi:hypothetical protein
VKYDGEKCFFFFFFFFNCNSLLRVGAAQCQKIFPVRGVWPGRLAGNSEGASRISK